MLQFCSPKNRLRRHEWNHCVIHFQRLDPWSWIQHRLGICSTADLCKFVYCRHIGRLANLDNTHSNESSAFRWGLFYSHNHGIHLSNWKKLVLDDGGSCEGWISEFWQAINSRIFIPLILSAVMVQSLYDQGVNFWLSTAPHLQSLTDSLTCHIL